MGGDSFSEEETRLQSGRLVYRGWGARLRRWETRLQRGDSSSGGRRLDYGGETLLRRGNSSRGGGGGGETRLQRERIYLQFN